MTQTEHPSFDPKAKFWLGGLIVTKNAETELEHEDIEHCVNRHLSGDWGDLCAEDKDANEQALQFGGRLFSAYHDRKGVKFWIITEADRSATTVLLPDDY
jgi:hypothetical protein